MIEILRISDIEARRFVATYREIKKITKTISCAIRGSQVSEVRIIGGHPLEIAGWSCFLTAMDVWFRKISGERHTLRIRRSDGTEEAVELNSRSFLRHDLAHFAVESELSISRGFWGSVAAGQALTGDSIEGADAELAERLAGPTQTLIREDRPVEDYLALLRRVVPERASGALASAVHERVRRLRGHWQATAFGEEMPLSW